MKKIFLGICLLLSAALPGFACPACQRSQPRILKGITHGTGPESKWDYVIIWIAVAIVMSTLFFSIKWLLRPGEKSAAHIKRSILNND